MVHHAYEISTKLNTFISYLPIALYAESLSVPSTLIRAISCSYTVPVPLTGCVKDIGRLWHLTQDELFEKNDFIVASRRHGNTFNLANSNLLQHCGVVGRKFDWSSSPSTAHRPTILHITFLTPGGVIAVVPGKALSYAFFCVEIMLLTTSCVLQIAKGFHIGGALMICMIAILLIQILLQHSTNIVFGKAHDLIQDKAKTVIGGAATDVHIIGKSFNKSEFDVLVGYSSQLHALSNITIRVPHWKKIRWAVRSLVIVLTVQAALLSSLFGRTDKQCISGMIWFASYILLQTPQLIHTRYQPDSSLHQQPARTRKVPPLLFSGRRTALTFINAIPMTAPQVDPWDWLDGFMPPNERRKRWEREITASGVLSPACDAEDDTQIEKGTKVVFDEVRAMQRNTDYADALREYLMETKLASTTTN